MRWTAILTGFVLSLLIGCYSIKIVNVKYMVPDETGVLKGRKVYLAFKDNRKVYDILSPSAKQELRDFSGYFAFSVSRKDDVGFRIGTFNVETMIKEAFKRRLESAGAVLIPSESREDYTMVISLNRFIIDLRKRTWSFEMSYDVKLKKGKKLFGSRSISGEAERVKIFGVSQLERIMSELFTKLINRCDLKGLFQQEGNV